MMREKTISEEIYGLAPKIEKLKSLQIIQKYARNKGQRNSKTTEYFDMQWEAFAWAAIIGFHYDKRKPLTGETTTHFKFSVINNNSTDIFYSLILFTVAQDGYEILGKPRSLVKSIEEYANGGFDVIFSILAEKGQDYFDYDQNFLQEVIDRKTKSFKNTKESSTNERLVDSGDGKGFSI